MPLQYELGLVRAGGNVPEANEVVARGCSEEIGGGGMENHLSNFTVDIYTYMSARDIGGIKGMETYRPPALSLSAGLKSSGSH